jgi:predicted O-linked N-acetylglucosamine transferase (SPINDLY family)
MTDAADPAAWVALGREHQQHGRPADAVACFERSLALDPRQPRVLNSLGLAHVRSGQLPPAERAFRAAVDLDPAYEKALHNLANVLAEQDRHADAVAYYHRAGAAGYRHPSLYDGWAGSLAALGDVRGAEAMLQKAVREWPDDPGVNRQLGKVLSLQLCWDGAAACLRKAVLANPDDPHARKLYGALLIRLGRLDQAERHLREALRLNPADADAGADLGVALLQQAKLDEADAVLRQVLALAPDHFAAHAHRLYLLNYDHRRTPEELLAEHKAWAARFAKATPSTDFPNDPSPTRRLRVGYVSPDFRRHPVGRFLDPILAHHDPARVEVFCYDEAIRPPDDVTARLRSLAHHWRLCRGLSANRFAELVRADRIDVLVELTGHTADNRLAALARRLAPVQVTYLGYPNTTGVPAIDYLLTDAVVDPPDEPTHLTERAYRLPHGFCCFAPRDDAPAVSELPAARNGHLTFGAPHALGKLNAAVLDLWARVLTEVPTAKLVIARNNLGPGTRDSLREKFAARGVPAERLVLQQLQSGEGEYLGFYRDVDVTLDPFPWTGHTTSCEALWMGVPTITLRGDRHAARMVASVTTHAGLADWVADTPDDYVALAVRWSKDVAKLAALRAGLREAVRRSRLCDGPGFARQLEDAYRTMWRTWSGANEPRAEVCKDSGQETITRPLTGHGSPADSLAHGRDLLRTNPAEAEALARRFTAQHPTHPDGWALLGDACKVLGKAADAIPAYRRAVELNPGHAAALNSLAILVAGQGRRADAELLFRRAVAAKPDHAKAHGNLGNVLSEQGKWAEAVAAYEAAVRHGHADASVLASLGLALAQVKRFDDAAKAFTRVTEAAPNDPKPFVFLGNAHLELNRPPEALAAYRRAEALGLHDAAVFDGQTQALLKMSDYPQAVRAASEAVRVAPDDPEMLKRLGFVLNKVAKFEASVDAYKRAIALRPDDAEAHWRLGMVHTRQGFLDKAIAANREAVRLQPNAPGYLNGLASAHIQNGDIDDALRIARQAIALNPDYAEAYSSLLFTLCYDPNATPEAVFEEHKAWAARFAPAPAAIAPHANGRDPNRRLRVGYVSPDLRNHPVGFFVEPLILNHDPGRVELVCYDECVWPPDQLAARLQAKVPTWRISRGMTDAQLAEQIRADRIDVLVDLAGHTASNRLRLFVMRPAPVQVTYLGYPNTTGVPNIDYFLTDPVADPPDQPAFLTEKPYHLPHGFCVFAPRAGNPDVGPSPTARGFVTFGSMHNQAKLNPKVLDLWAEVLKAVPTARMLFVRHTLTEGGREALRKAYAARGVDPARLDFRQPRAGSAEYLRHYPEMDVQLDPFPWTGHTTGCESLWMGVPMVTLRGRTHAGRMVASVLHSAGLPDWIAETPDEYVRLAARWANDRPALAALRAGLREKLLRSKLCDAAGFARQVEDAYRAMWRAWCAAA